MIVLTAADVFSTAADEIALDDPCERPQPTVAVVSEQIKSTERAVTVRVKLGFLS